MSGKESYTLFGKPDLHDTSLIAGWQEDASHVGSQVIDYLIQQLSARDFCTIEPEQFFTMEGVTVEDDMALFPDSRFYCSPEKNLVLLLSAVPATNWHSFLNLVMDIAVNHCDVRNIYTVGGMVGNIAHTVPRSLYSVFTDSEIKEDIMGYRLSETTDYESPPGQRPTISSYLLWMAQQRNISGANFWASVPFYLVEDRDMQAYRRILELLDRKLALGLDLSPLDEEIGRQKEKFSRILNMHPELGGYIQKLESHLSLTEEESEHLEDVMIKYLRH